ncbi:MAG: hypothetical protein K0R67_2658 [Paenibacillus sp.]|jgi:hypothetical protein|nr:hypothetical protein [Paenibacillus sp.]
MPGDYYQGLPGYKATLELCAGQTEASADVLKSSSPDSVRNRLQRFKGEHVFPGRVNLRRNEASRKPDFYQKVLFRSRLRGRHIGMVAGPANDEHLVERVLRGYRKQIAWKPDFTLSLRGALALTVWNFGLSFYWDDTRVDDAAIADGGFEQSGAQTPNEPFWANIADLLSANCCPSNPHFA